MMKILLLCISLLPCLVQAGLLNTNKLDEYGRSIYKGQVTLTGTYSRSEYEWGPTTCFIVDIKDSKKIPRPQGDVRVPWFCFENEKQVNKVLKLPNQLKEGVCAYEGKATIKIKDYKLFTIATSGSDETKFISAKNITPYKTIKC